MTASKYQYTIFFAMLFLGLLLSILSTVIVYRQLIINLESEMQKTVKEELMVRKRKFEKTVLTEPRSILNALKQSALMAPLYFQNKKYVTKAQKELFTTVTATAPDIMQLRYIDAKGNEILQISRGSIGSDPFIMKNIIQPTTTPIITCWTRCLMHIVLI